MSGQKRTLENGGSDDHQPDAAQSMEPPSKRVRFESMVGEFAGKPSPGPTHSPVTSKNSTSTVEELADSLKSQQGDDVNKNHIEEVLRTRKARTLPKDLVEPEIELHDYGVGEKYANKIDDDGGVQDEDGNQFEPFSMDNELSKGYFDTKSGAYVEQRKDKGEDEEEAQEDAWYDDFMEGKPTDDALKRIAVAKEKQESEAQATAVNVEKEIDMVLDLLQGDDETPLRALRRLRPQEHKVRLKKQVRKKTQAVSEDNNSNAATPPQQVSNEVKEANSAAFVTLTNAADRLITQGLPGIYSETKVSLKLRRDRANARRSRVKFEYKKNEEAEVHGPFTAEQMVGWSYEGYFGTDTPVMIRRVLPDGDRNDWKAPDEISFV
eukprot:TRINITY_DN8626_c0_g1_i1.p1 TRINITY_DN8626_c0_g1~~TRINITY_DN8626_c0_g1_i1.p1  ORF type:complete len:379 (+),score=73.37 TRINITY_DN8626_c0_g1_i1:189-1325(+)